jgi:hypothetical protein
MDPDGSITSIDNCSCRRIVLSVASYWRGCENGKLRIDIAQPLEVRQGDKDVSLPIPAPGVHADAEVNLGLGIRIKSQATTATVPLTVKFDVEDTAPLGMHSLTVVNPDDVVGIKRDAVNVLPKAKAPAPGGANAAPVSPEVQAAPAKKRPRKGTGKDNS